MCAVLLPPGDNPIAVNKYINQYYRPVSFREGEAGRFPDNRHMKVVRLSALGTGRLYPPGNIPGTHFC